MDVAEIFQLDSPDFDIGKINFPPRSDRNNLSKIEHLKHVQNNSILELQVRPTVHHVFGRPGLIQNF